MIKFNNYDVYGAIFDMDGTMFDTERLRLKTLKQASKEIIGTEFSDTYLIACLGLSAKSAHNLAQQQYGEDIPYANIRKRADELELESIRSTGVPIKKGLVQVLERLRKSGLKMAVATSSRRAIAEEYLINANVYKFFDVIVCGDEVQKGKPNPEIFISAAEKINVKPSECFMFEDSENGIQSAYDANGITVLFQDIKEPTENMLAKSFFFFESMYDYLESLDQVSPKLDLPQLNDPFPQTLNQLSVGIHGFGAIGGGYIAQIFSHWDGYTRPKKIYASTYNPLYLSAVNAFGSYGIRYNQFSYDERIENIEIINSNCIEKMHEMYIQSSMIAICLPEEAIEEEAHIIAQGLYARYIANLERFTNPLTLLIILNKIGAKKLWLDKIHNALEKITTTEITVQILDHHYFCDTVVNRMVSRTKEQNLLKQLRIKNNIIKIQNKTINYEQKNILDNSQLNIDQKKLASSYLGEIMNNSKPNQALQSTNLILFHAETDMPIYVENQSPLIQKMRQMILVDDIKEIQFIKNRLWNGVHAIVAWYALLLGYQTIGVAMSDERITTFMDKALKQVKSGLSFQFPSRHSDLNVFTENFKKACLNAYKDPCERVARDPLRKLSLNERVLGSIIFNFKNNLPYEYLMKGMSYGYQYAVETKQISSTEVFNHLKLQLNDSNLQDLEKEQLLKKYLEV